MYAWETEKGRGEEKGGMERQNTKLPWRWKLEESLVEKRGRLQEDSIYFIQNHDTELDILIWAGICDLAVRQTWPWLLPPSLLIVGTG